MSSLAGVDVMSKAAESLNYSLRRIVKDKDAFRNGEALMKWVIAGKIIYRITLFVRYGLYIPVFFNKSLFFNNL